MAETATRTLTEFLLARIAEDEERAQFVARQIEGNHWTPFEQWRLSWHDEYDLLCIEPSRALAECEAKRRIVEWHAPMSDYADASCRCEYDDWSNDNPPFPCPTLRALALPYADHPDYRDEWRA